MRSGIRQRSGAKRYLEDEPRALAHFAFHPDAATVHLDEFLGDAQAKAGAAVLRGNSGVGLLELGKEAADLVRRNANTGIGERPSFSMGTEREVITSFSSTTATACGLPSRKERLSRLLTMCIGRFSAANRPRTPEDDTGMLGFSSSHFEVLWAHSAMRAPAKAFPIV